MNGNRSGEDAALETLFDAARSDTPAPDAAFLARLSDDAEASLPQPELAPIPNPAPRNWLKGLFAASGLTGAALTGIWIGFVMPETLEALAYGTESDTFELSSVLPGADLSVLAGE